MLTVNSIKFNNYRPTFGAHVGLTGVAKQVEKDNFETNYVNNYTEFFRDYRTTNFVKNYLFNNFSKGTDIAEFGCSTGQKPFSLMIVLEPNNKDRKYKITGYDFKEVIEKLSKAKYSLDPTLEGEAFLMKNFTYLDTGFPNIPPEQKEPLRKTFFEYFKQYDYPNISVEDYSKAVQATNRTNLYIFNNKELTKYFTTRTLFEEQRRGGMMVIPKSKIFEVVSFKTGDINDISQILEPQKTGVIIFQNALYHILNGGSCYGKGNYIQSFNKNVHKVEKLFKDINKSLPMNGIFVIGNNPKDHGYTDKLDDYSFDLSEIKQNGIRMTVYNSSQVHDYLRKAGFEPIFYDAHISSPFTIHYPAVWKKIKEVA